MYSWHPYEMVGFAGDLESTRLDCSAYHPRVHWKYEVAAEEVSVVKPALACSIVDARSEEKS